VKFISAAVVVIGITAILWSAASLISQETTRSEESRRVAQNDASKPAIDASTFIPTGKLLEKSKNVEADPENLELRFEYAENLLRAGTQQGDVSAIIASVAQFNTVLSSNPEHSPSLLALARVSFETGAAENSIGYFDRYLKLNPDDKRARNDLALAYLQIGDNRTAIAILDELTFRHQDYFESRFGLAMARRLAGDTETATKDAEIAINLAQTDRQRQAVESFLSTTKLRAEPIREAKSPSIETGSDKKEALEDYLKNHPILSEKLVSISWKSENEAEVTLREFPISSMPEVAKQTFRAKAKAQLSPTLKTQPFKVTLIEQENKESRFNLLQD